MVINGKVVNNIHCNYLHANGCDNSSNPVYLPPDYEPAVGNGLMMVVVQPKLQVNNFKPDDLIGFVGDQSLYLGPGTNYGVAGQTPDGSQAVILDHPLDGIWAKGSFIAANNCRFFWWYVKANNGVKGWTLLPESSPQATPYANPYRDAHAAARFQLLQLPAFREQLSPAHLLAYGQLHRQVKDFTARRKARKVFLRIPFTLCSVSAVNLQNGGKMKVLFIGGTGIISSACARLALERGIESLPVKSRPIHAAGA